jgi:hypothetical protein
MHGWKPTLLVGATVAILTIAGAVGGKIAAAPTETAIGCLVLRDVPGYQVKVDMAASAAPAPSANPAAPIPARPSRQDLCK